LVISLANLIILIGIEVKINLFGFELDDSQFPNQLGLEVG
jgi:hypothetical protein